MRYEFLRRKIAFGIFFAALPLMFAACGDNAIEAEAELQNEAFDSKGAALKKFDNEQSNLAFYVCKQAYGANRCINIYKTYGSYDCPEMSDTKNYNDKGEYVGPASSSSEPESSSSEPESSSSEPVKYLTVNKTLNLTVTSYKQTVDSISETEEIGDPEVKFIVNTYSDDELVNTPMTALVLDTTDVKEWEGVKAATVLIPRGIDKIEICPIVLDENEFDDTVLSDDECFTIEDIGLIENKEVFEQTLGGTKDLKFKVEWSWDLYDPEAKD